MPFLIQTWWRAGIFKMTATGPSKEEGPLGGYLFCQDQTWLHLVWVLSKIFGRWWGQCKWGMVYSMWRPVVGAVGQWMNLQGRERSWTFHWGSAGRWRCRTHISKASSVVYSCSNLCHSTGKICQVFSVLLCTAELVSNMETQVRHKKGYLLARTDRNTHFSCPFFTGAFS